MSRKEYRVVHKIPNITAPMYCDSLEEAKQYVEPAGKYAPDWVIQVRTVTEWRMHEQVESLQAPVSSVLVGGDERRQLGV